MPDGAERAAPSGRDRVEIGFGLFLLALAALVLWGARSIRPAIYDSLGSAALPVAAAGIVGGLVLWALVSAVTRPVGPLDRTRPAAAVHDRPVLALGFLVLTVLFALLLSSGLLGFSLAGFLYLAASGLLLARRGGRTAVTVVAIAAVLAFGGGLLFTRFFYIALP